MVLPGLGQLYNGAGRWAAIIFAIGFVELLVFNALFSSTAIHSIETFWVAMALLVPAFAFYVFVIVDAYLGARRTGELDLRRYNRWFVYVGIIVAANVMAYAVDYLPFDTRAYSMPSSSMVPTLQPGDYVLAAPYAYRSSEPERGDVVVFEPANGSGYTYVKRVVGLPGDEIQIQDGLLRINGESATRDSIGVSTRPPPQGLEPAMVYWETLPSGHTHRIEELHDDRREDTTRVYRVPADHYFMLGDNRDRSSDSRRAQVGFVPQENLRGRVLYIWWSRDLSRLGPLTE